VNFAADPKFAKTRADMEQRLMDELKRTGDPRLVEGGKFFDTAPMAGPLTKPAAKKPGKRK
jgi:N-sulfoglucosamine sulfohydrolase